MSEQDKIKESCEHIFIGKPPFCSKCGARKPEQEKLKVPFEVRTFNDNAGRVLVCLLPIDGAAPQWRGRARATAKPAGPYPEFSFEFGFGIEVEVKVTNPWTAEREANYKRLWNEVADGQPSPPYVPCYDIPAMAVEAFDKFEAAALEHLPQARIDAARGWLEQNTPKQRLVDGMGAPLPQMKKGGRLQ